MVSRLRLAFAALLALLPALMLGSAHAAAVQAPRVLVVHSYHQNYLWTKLMNKGLAEALKGLGADVETVYLDAKRNPDPDFLRRKAEEIMARLEAFRPQVVVAADDAAQEHVVVPYLKGRDGVQVVFCGVNEHPAKYGYPAANVSGVRERWHYRDGLALLAQLVPNLKSVAMILDDSETGRGAVADLRETEREGGALPVRLGGVEMVHTFRQWKAAVQRHQTRSQALVLPLYHSLVDEDSGRIVPPEEVMAWTNSVNRLPTLGLVDYAREHGLLCGVLESAQEQGWLAGSMAREVLTRGVSAGSLPIRTNRRGLVLLNLKTAQRLKIQVPYHLIESAGQVIQ